jgi:hypothetical protein
MSKAEVLQALVHLTLEEKLEVIEVASRLLRQELIPTSEKPSLAVAAEIMRPFYESGSDLTELTDQASEEFYEYENYA